MSTTLTNGLKLPDKGSVDWYADMQSNYTILDGAVGTVAEHSTQISGKAPLVHTHTKSDVTDLLNSNFIPSANNSYDLGSSSYQWNNLYAKNYFYNGTAWGLDKANTWTGENTFQAQSIYQVNNDPRYVYKSSSLEIGVQPTGSHTATSYWLDKNDNNLGYTRFVEYANGIQTYEIYVRNLASNGALNPNGSQIAGGLQLALFPSTATSSVVANTTNVIPGTTNAIDLGTPTNKWKTLNGVNPGALSLPSSSYDPIDTDNWDLTGVTSQSYTPTVNGWIFLSVQNVAGNFISMSSGRGAIAIDGNGNQAGLRAVLSVVANESVGILVKTGAVFAARFYPNQGNV